MSVVTELTGREAAIASIPPQAVCAEIGVWKGDYSQRIADRARPKELNLIDPWLFAPQYPKRWYGGARARDQSDMDRVAADVIDRFAGHSEIRVHRMPSLRAAEHFATHYFDWIYIDGDHATKFVLDDLNAWFPKVKAGGQIWLDDYRWLDEHGKLSVREAICAFLASGPELVGRENDGQFQINVPGA